MDIRRENCVRAFEELGMKNANDLLGEYSQAGVFAGIENGDLSVGEFHDEIRRLIGRDVSDQEIDGAFQRFLIGIPEHRLDELEDLHRRYGIYMLSNTNPIMWAGEIDRNFRQRGHDVNYYFDGIVRSYKAGVMKPDAEIFRAVLRDFDIKAEETLFLDDSQRNLDAAARMGFRTLLVAPGQEFSTLLKETGIGV